MRLSVVIFSVSTDVILLTFTFSEVPQDNTPLLCLDFSLSTQDNTPLPLVRYPGQHVYIYLLTFTLYEVLLYPKFSLSTQDNTPLNLPKTVFLYLLPGIHDNYPYLYLLPGTLDNILLPLLFTRYPGQYTFTFTFHEVPNRQYALTFTFCLVSMTILF